MLYPLNYGGIYEIYKSYAFVGYPLFLHKKLRQGATQGTKSLRDFLQARVFAVSLTFSRVFTHITKGEQHLRRRSLYPAELLGQLCTVPIYCITL